MPSHRKPASRGGKKEAKRTERRGVVGQGRAGKRKNQDLKENANKYLLEQALKDLENYMDHYENWDKQRGGPFYEERLARLVANKKLLESLRDNTLKNTSNIIVQTVTNAVRYSLGEFFDSIDSEQKEDELVKSISDLRLLQD